MKKPGLRRLKKITQIIILFSGLWLTADSCFAQEVSSIELIQLGTVYDGKVVVYKGEAIGEIMRRKDGAWVNIDDGQASIGVWMPLELADNIQYTGSYKAKGDFVQVKGIFNHACLRHGGDLDIHATSLMKIKAGGLKQEKVIPAKRNFLIILLVLTCLVSMLRISIIR